MASGLLGNFKPKVACACMSDVPPSPGALVQDNLGDIRCGKMSFNGDGTIAAVVFCNDFEVLSR